MEEELSMLKKSLISLVVSSPTTMTVSRLLKDYRSMIGGVLPLAKFGYREPVPFLKERCTDIFVIEGPSWDPILTPKVTKNLAHIDKMVQKQKVQSTVKHKGKRRSILQPNPPVEAISVPRSNPPNRYDPPNRYNPPNTFDPQNKYEQQNRHIPLNGFNIPNNENKPPVGQYEIFTKLQNHAYPNTTHDLNKENEHISKHTDCTNDYKTIQHDSTKSASNNNEKEHVSANSVEEDGLSSALNKFYKKRLPQYNSDIDFPSPDSEKTSKSSVESGRLSSNGSSSKQALLEDLKEEIIVLIENSPDGVWCTDLIRLYKETYGRELKFSRFGHTRLISLIYSMEDQVVISRPAPDSDWLLQHRSLVGPEAGAGSAAGGPAPRPVPRALPVRASQTDLDDALPGVDFEADVFPADCLHYLDSVPGAALPAAAPGAALEVLLGEVYSPSHFWMLLVGDQHSGAMDLIMDEMNSYYRGEGAARELSRGAVRAGQYCAALFEDEWHRSLIVQVIDSDTVKVRHVDYGTVATVSARALKPLRREWGRLPAQAVRARLAGARPAAAGWRWPRAACAWFLRRVQQRRLYAHVLRRDPQEDIVETFLIDTERSEDACLTSELIRVGHADARHDSALQSEDCYLYPRFEALESGATPNYADISRMLADGIALEYVDEYRRYVPGPWARRAAPALPPPPQPPLEVRLSAAEWAVLARLRAADPAAAHWYLLTSACRAMMPPPPGL